MAGQLLSSSHCFAVPTLIARRLRLNLPGVVSKKRVATICGGFEILAEVFVCNGNKCFKKVVALLLKHARQSGLALDSEFTQVDGVSTLLFYVKAPTVEARNLTKGNPDSTTSLLQEMFVGLDMRSVLRWAQYSGFRVVYCYNDLEEVTQPPFLETPGTIYVFAYARPPGLSKMDLGVSELFRMKVWAKGETRMVEDPINGRGRVIEEDGIPIWQVLGSNYYQLCLTHSPLHNVLNREAIFRKLLDRLYLDLVQGGGRRAKKTLPLTAAEFVTFAEGAVDNTVHDLREQLEKMEAEAQRIQEQLFEKLRERQDCVVRIKAMAESSFVQELKKGLPHAFKEIRSIEGVRDVAVVDDGLHLYTESIVLEDDDCKRNLGPFTVRLDSRGHVEVWSEAPRHPKGHHHPHISRVDLACFGNVSVALGKYMSMHDWSNAARLAMSWLRSYSKETTLYPLEEWPTKQKKGGRS